MASGLPAAMSFLSLAQSSRSLEGEVAARAERPPVAGATLATLSASFSSRLSNSHGYSILRLRATLASAGVHRCRRGGTSANHGERFARERRSVLPDRG